MTGAKLADWIIRNLLNESQLAVIPPGETQALRFLAAPEESETVDPREVIADLYWLFKWYSDEHPDAEPPADLVRFDGASDTVGRARTAAGDRLFTR